MADTLSGKIKQIIEEIYPEVVEKHDIVVELSPQLAAALEALEDMSAVTSAAAEANAASASATQTKEQIDAIKLIIDAQQSDVSTKAEQIQTLSVASVQLAEGEQANAVYNPGANQFVFYLPKGATGDKGDPYMVNALGTMAQRDSYDDEEQGFSFLDTQNMELYVKATGASADWAGPSPFGRGETGPQGENVQMQLSGAMLQYKLESESVWHDLVDLSASVTHAGRTDNPHQVTPAQIGIRIEANTSWSIGAAGDFSTAQAAFDAAQAVRVAAGAELELLVLSGTTLAATTVAPGEYSGVVLRAEDAEVPLGGVFKVTGAHGLALSVLFDAAGSADDGVWVEDSQLAFTSNGAAWGCQDAPRYNLAAVRSRVVAEAALLNGAGVACVMAERSEVSLEGASCCTITGVYGLHADDMARVQGKLATFQGTANSVRATNGGEILLEMSILDGDADVYGGGRIYADMESIMYADTNVVVGTFTSNGYILD